MSETFKIKITKKYIYVWFPDGRNTKELRQNWDYDSGFIGGCIFGAPPEDME